MHRSHQISCILKIFKTYVQLVQKFIMEMFVQSFFLVEGNIKQLLANCDITKLLLLLPPPFFCPEWIHTYVVIARVKKFYFRVKKNSIFYLRLSFPYYLLVHRGSEFLYIYFLFSFLVVVMTFDAQIFPSSRPPPPNKLPQTPKVIFCLYEDSKKYKER